MKALWMKDCMILENQKRFFMGIVFLLGILVLMGKREFSISFATMVFTMFTVSTIAYDEYDNGYAFLMTLPFSRKAYVLSKYIFGLALGSVSGLLMVLVNIFVAWVLHAEVDFTVLWISYGSVLASVLLLMAVYIPLILKFGSESSRLAIVGFVGVFFLIGLGLNALGLPMEAIFQNMTNLEPACFGVLVFGIVFLVYGFSCWLSVIIMKRKTF